MLVAKRSLIRNPKDLAKKTKEELSVIKDCYEKNEYLFVIPFGMSNNVEKSEYKVWFLRKFIKSLYPDKTFGVIYSEINRKWQVFKGDRQMERLCSSYEQKKDR